MSDEKDLAQGFTEVDMNFPCNESELKSHSSVNCENLKAMMLFEECIKNNFACKMNDLTDLEDCKELYDGDALSKYHEKILSLKKDIASTLEEKQKQIAENNKLTQEIAQIKVEIEKLNSEKKIECADKLTLKAYKMAENTYSKNFGIKIKVKINEDTTRNATVYFNPDKKNLAVNFHMDQNNKILSFDASSFLHKKQEKLLQERFAKTNNILALMCTLRKIALRRVGEQS